MKSKQKKMWSAIGTVFFTILAALWMYPIIMVIMNSLKVERAITTDGAFSLPTEETFAGLSNYVNALNSQGFLKSFGYSLFITVSSVFLILLCCSMCAWYINRVNSLISKLMYLLCAFSMVVPFQMVMFTLSQTADRFSIFGLKFNTPWTICFIYLGFGAGLAVFMFSGFVKSIPLEIEEASMIDGCSPLQTYFKVVLPILKPTMISVGILETMWVWNDYLLPSLVLNINKYKTIPIAVQYLKQSHGQIDWGAMMAVLVLAILPIVIFYIACQKYIIEGVLAGAVKG